VRNAQQAIAYVDGIEVVGNSNTLTGVIAGLTINLNQVSPSTGEPPVYETTTLNVEADTGELKEKISEFVSSYNEIMSWIVAGYATQGATTENTTDTESSEEENLSNMLRGDATINDIKRNLQGILSNAVGSSGSLQILSEIGISTQMDGTLLLNEGKLDVALENKFEDVVKLLSGEDGVDGVMKKFNTYLLEATSVTQGMYADKRERYDSAVRRLDNQIAQKEPQMAKIEERIRAQFNAMELLVSSLNSQSDYLTQQMDMLTNLSRGNR
jgi:flagellar hook-associated protein 2